MQEKIFDLLLEKEDVTWKSLIYDLVKTEQMNPWDINVTLLTQKYIQTIKKMQEHDLRISGKILLAAAILLKLKSSHLLDHDISQLDNLINQSEEEFDDDEFLEELNGRTKRDKQAYQLIPRNPQPRSRKVAVNDLVEALQRAMATKKRVLSKRRPTKFKMPKKGIDLGEVIKDVFNKIDYYLKKEKSKKITFTRLLPVKAGKHEKVITFMPLLHLENQKKVEINQPKHFDEIFINLFKRRKKS